MDITQFMQESGFKVLAVAKLNEIEYSIVLYLLNCSASGLNEIITNRSELASLTAYETEQLSSALASLAERRMIEIRKRETHHSENPHASISLKFQFDTDRWRLNIPHELTTQDAIVYPFRRDPRRMMSLHKTEDRVEAEETWQKVMTAFTDARTLSEDELAHEERAARILTETHPLDLILLIITHFERRITTLSLLASSWAHYQELFEVETQRIDFSEARKKHGELDEKLRNSARDLLEKKDNFKLSDEEIAVLKLLINHSHPRRQLFWAYQTSNRYQSLHDFFIEHLPIMLPVTTNGTIVRKT